MMNSIEQTAAPNTTGRLIHWALRYDLLLSLVSFGRERVYREQALRLASLKMGESVLDVGCGTGTLAIAAKGHVGQSGTVCGIDASPEMIARAIKKASKSGVDVVFKNAAAEEVPFPNAQFDVVLSTLMLHHLPRKPRQQCIQEIRRVLKPGGRFLVVDFGGPAPRGRDLFSQLHRHGQVNLRDLITLLSDSGLSPVESGALGIGDLQFVLAAAPSPNVLEGKP